MQLQVIESAHGSTEDVTARLHRRFPCARIDVEARHDRRKRAVDVASLVVSDCATGPIDELQVLLERGPPIEDTHLFCWRKVRVLAPPARVS